VAELLILKGAEVNAGNNQGIRALHSAAGMGHEEIAELLIEHGAQVDLKDDKYGSTALQWACGYGHRETAELLIEKGADVNAAEDRFGRTPLHWAAARGHAEVVTLLVKHGADLAVTDKDGKTAKELAEEKAHEDISRFLDVYH
jgi:ankyrin repeat protein